MILGVDSDTYRICYVALNEDTATFHSSGMILARMSKEWFERYSQLLPEWYHLLHDWDGPKKIYIEDSAYRSYGAAHKLAKVMGGALAISFVFTKEVHLVPANTWKKVILGHGRASKEMAQKVAANHPLLFGRGLEESHHMADAACIALYGLNQHQ